MRGLSPGAEGTPGKTTGVYWTEVTATYYLGTAAASADGGAASSAATVTAASLPEFEDKSGESELSAFDGEFIGMEGEFMVTKAVALALGATYPPGCASGKGWRGLAGTWQK